MAFFPGANASQRTWPLETRERGMIISPFATQSRTRRISEQRRALGVEPSPLRRGGEIGRWQLLRRSREPYAQVLFVPKDSNFQLVEMTPEEDAKRRELEHAIQESRSEIADHFWKHPDNTQLFGLARFFLTPA